MRSFSRSLAFVALAVPGIAQIPGVAHPSTTIEFGQPLRSFTTLRADWPTFGNGPAHTGYFPDAIDDGTLQPSWSIATGQKLQQVAIGAGRVYVTPWQYFTNAWLRALDAGTGGQLWSHTFASCYSINPPTYDAGKVYVQRGDHSNDTHLWSFHADSGIPFWIAPHSAQWERYLAPCVADGKVWVNGGYYGGMYGFEQADGQQLFFNQSLQQYDGWTPSWYAGALYSFVAGQFRRHDPGTGAQVWMKDLGWNWAGWTMDRTSAIANGRAFVVNNPNLYAIDLTSGQVEWSVTGSFFGTPAVANGVVYVLGQGFVNAYDAWSGQYLGVYPGESGLIGQPLVLDDLVIFSSSAKTFLYRRASFAPYSTLAFGGYTSLANRKLYVATPAGELRTFDFTQPSTPEPNLVAEWQPWTPSAGAEASVLTVTNYGLANATPTRLLVFASDDTVLDPSDTWVRGLSTAAMVPGESLAVSVHVPSAAGLAGKFLLAVPDAPNRIAESNEQNVAPSNSLP
jgi:hypothetical protein